MENARPPTVFGASTVTAVPFASASVENVATAPAPFASAPSVQFAPSLQLPPWALPHALVVATAAGPGATVTVKGAASPSTDTSRT